MALHQELQKVDPLADKAIPPNNVERVIRALEVNTITGRPSLLSKRKAHTPPPGTLLGLGFEWTPVLTKNG